MGQPSCVGKFISTISIRTPSFSHLLPAHAPPACQIHSEFGEERSLTTQRRSEPSSKVICGLSPCDLLTKWVRS